MDAVYQEIYKAIKRVPRGQVATYGQIAKIAGLGNQPRRVGYALSICEGKVPWHRIINAKGEISARWEPDAMNMQKLLLMKEGVVFDKNGRIDLGRFQWKK